MITTFTWQGKVRSADLRQPVEISLPLRDGSANPNAFHAPDPDFSPLEAENFIGAVYAGSPVNFFNVRFNPHGNGTHTECVGHISSQGYTVYDALSRYHWMARLLTIQPRQLPDGDQVISLAQLQDHFLPGDAEALILRTLPNSPDKRHRNYSGTNPPYLESAAAHYLVTAGVQHLLLDLPSVDREEDGGALAAHHAFWQYPQCPRTQATITELIYVPDAIADGAYLLGIYPVAWVLDAAPSRILLYALE